MYKKKYFVLVNSRKNLYRNYFIFKKKKNSDMMKLGKWT